MNKNLMFSREEQTLIRAEKIASDERCKDSPLYAEFMYLANQYQRLLKQSMRVIRLSDKQQSGLIFELEQAFESFIRTLVTTIEAKHQFTAGHSARVTEYVLFIGDKIGISAEDMEVLKYAGLLHDIGKIGIPDSVLTKNGHFSPDERQIMKEHSVWTWRILSGIHLPRNLCEIPRMAACHHEKMDGTGYPYGLKGDEIPFFSRILAVGDVFDALTSRRDYPKYVGEKVLSVEPMSIEMALLVLAKDQNTHFDPSVVSVLLNHRSEFEILWQELHKKAVT
ncbi:MAG: HD-GYP domain-containing protein [Nitrospirae bacterium]|nr:HD-GYP domain-containing protein [Nitrospirota bacterium]MBF0534080.1 HD-GYP domain-containing protein [Nitrospirota bacterium]MBF0616239.1 HD-GYP domain-containing protein [Nitrospirota bacterium]